MKIVKETRQRLRKALDTGSGLTIADMLRIAKEADRKTVTQATALFAAGYTTQQVLRKLGCDPASDLTWLEDLQASTTKGKT